MPMRLRPVGPGDHSDERAPKAHVLQGPAPYSMHGMGSRTRMWTGRSVAAIHRSIHSMWTSKVAVQDSIIRCVFQPINAAVFHELSPPIHATFP